MIPQGFQTALEGVLAGKGIMVLLGLISVWVWALIITSSLRLHEIILSERKIRKSQPSCTSKAPTAGPDGLSCHGSLVSSACPWERSGTDSEMLPGHIALCCQVEGLNIRPKLRKHILRVSIDAALRILSANVRAVLLLSSLAPLLGLLGTVEGMISTFTALSVQGNADSSALTEGISKALVTTQGGLLVAIPGLLAGGILFRKVKKLRDRLYAISLRTEPGKAQRIHMPLRQGVKP